ncbi:hypothetical protein B0J11DRAFT_255252 [Dendryphion nanum]|uniref:Uncharacterized protein n=1 Tax=Dendryphion nanum TaxID=256645 RepID=A0A9P9E4T0_9PLEO|nr:hypothetical protein B0J11DRAFT_255252 [Dendryphion nanum]
MGKEFFNGWDLWQKMTFVLACGIVFVFILGLIKLRYNALKLRKYTKVEKGKKAQTPEMLEAQPVRLDSADTSPEVPFGVRAIESGIEVDGVWISRTNTPVGSSRSSMVDLKLPRSHNSSNLELPKAAYASSSRDSSRAPSSAFDRAVSAERVHTNESVSSSPIYDSFRGRAVIPSSSRQSYSNMRDRDSMTLSALEGLEGGSSSARHQPVKANANSAKSGQSSRTSDESDYMNIQDARPYEVAYLHPKNASLAPADPRTDLNLLQSHRLSHVAETGQLTPRVRKPGTSAEWASTAENMRSPQEIVSTNGVDYFVPQQKTPSPPPPAFPTSPEELPATSSSMFNDAHSSNQARQGVPLLETYAPQSSQAPRSYQPRGPQYEYEHEEESPYTVVQTEQNQRDSNVVRKVNSGFEILKPGTFGEPTSPEEEQPSEKRQSKRLQKRRKSSGGSRTSHFVEQV